MFRKRIVRCLGTPEKATLEISRRSFKFQLMSILASCINNRQETVPMPKYGLNPFIAKCGKFRPNFKISFSKIVRNK